MKKREIIIANCEDKDKKALRVGAARSNKNMTEYLLKLIHYANDRNLIL